jgi:hypothetical protein
MMREWPGATVCGRYAGRAVRAALAVALLVIGAPASQTMAAELLADLPFTHAELQRVLHGELVTRTVKPPLENDLVVSMAFLTNAPRHQIVRRLSEAGLPHVNPPVTAFGEISGSGTVEDFQAVQLSPHGQEEARHYLGARGGDTLNLAASEIAEFNALATAGKSAPAAVEAQLRQLLLSRYRDYKTQGLVGIAPYTRANGKPHYPANDVRRAADELRVVEKYLPALYDLLLSYPNRQPLGFRESFFWLNYDVDGRPDLVLTHRMVVPIGEAYAVVSRQFYVSHGYDVAQEIALLISTPKGRLVFYQNRTSTDPGASFGAAMTRARARTVMHKEIAGIFNQLRREAEQKGDGS